MTCKNPYCILFPACVGCKRKGADIEKAGRAINKALSDVTSFPDLRKMSWPEDC